MQIKQILATLLALSAQMSYAAYEKIYDCRNETIYAAGDFMEEGLGVYGELDVDSDSQEVTVSRDDGKLHIGVGQMTYGLHEDRNEEITYKRVGTVDTYKVKWPGTYELLLKFYQTGRGIVLYREQSADAWDEMVAFDCSPVKFLESAAIGETSVRKLSQSKFMRLPEKVRDRLNAVDMAFELGDGYYDVKDSQIYEVVKKEGRKYVLQGYILWSKLSYTEDPEFVEAEQKLDRNGLRIGELEETARYASEN